MLKQLCWRDREAVCLVGRMERKRAKSSYRTRASPQIRVNTKGNKKKEIATCTNYLEIRCLKSKRTWKTVEKSFCQRMGKTEGRKQAKNCCLFFTSSVGQFDCLNYVHTKLWWTPKLKDRMKRIAERSRSHPMRSNAQWGDLICIRGHGELSGSRPKIHSETHHSVCGGRDAIYTWRVYTEKDVNPLEILSRTHVTILRGWIQQAGEVGGWEAETPVRKVFHQFK